MKKIYACVVLWLIAPALELVAKQRRARSIRALSEREADQIRQSLCAMAAKGDHADEIARMRRALLSEFAHLRGLVVSDPWVTGPDGQGTGS